MEALPASELADVRTVREDVELRLLEERLELLDSQRSLAAVRCQKFTSLLERAMVAGQGQGEPFGNHSNGNGNGNGSGSGVEYDPFRKTQKSAGGGRTGRRNSVDASHNLGQGGSATGSQGGGGRRSRRSSFEAALAADAAAAFAAAGGGSSNGSFSSNSSNDNGNGRRSRRSSLERDRPPVVVGGMPDFLNASHRPPLPGSKSCRSRRVSFDHDDSGAAEYYGHATPSNRKPTSTHSGPIPSTDPSRAMSRDVAGGSLKMDCSSSSSGASSQGTPTGTPSYVSERSYRRSSSEMLRPPSLMSLEEEDQDMEDCTAMYTTGAVPHLHAGTTQPQLHRPGPDVDSPSLGVFTYNGLQSTGAEAARARMGGGGEDASCELTFRKGTPAVGAQSFRMPGTDTSELETSEASDAGEFLAGVCTNGRRMSADLAASQSYLQYPRQALGKGKGKGKGPGARFQIGNSTDEADTSDASNDEDFLGRSVHWRAAPEGLTLAGRGHARASVDGIVRSSLNVEGEAPVVAADDFSSTWETSRSQWRRSARQPKQAEGGQAPQGLGATHQSFKNHIVGFFRK